MKHVAAALMVVFVVAISARANGDASLFAKGIAALEKGAHGEAIATFEQLADSGFTHADASYDRAVAYVQRARSPQARPGDLGRAAAAFTEALYLRPEDEGAERALTVVRNEIARRRSREGAEPVIVRPTLDRAVVTSASEDSWALAALLSAIVGTVGLLARRSTQRGVTLAGSIASALGLVGLVGFGALTGAARHLRMTTAAAVVVVPDARILDATGAAIVQRDGRPEYVTIPEGAEVELHQSAATTTKFRWGSIEGYVAAGDYRVIRRR